MMFWFVVISRNYPLRAKLLMPHPMPHFPFLEDAVWTNRPVTDEEHAQMAHLLAIYENKIADLTTKIADLDAEREALLDSAAPLRRGTSPFRRLPDDIIREIFLACLDTTRNPTMSCREAPVLLTRISSATRAVALSTPALWAAIHIPIIRHSKKSKPKRKAIRESIMSARARGAKEWLLQRSGNMPLSISVHEVPYSSPNELVWTNPLAEYILPVLLKCCARWRDVSFSIVSDSQYHLAALTPKQVPLIRSISLHGQHSKSAFAARVWWNSPLLTAPTIRKFDSSLPESTSLGHIYRFKVDWEKITDLSLVGGFIWDELLLIEDFEYNLTTAVEDTLFDANRLVSLKIELCRYQTLPLGPFPLPVLRDLVVIENGEPSARPGFLARMRAPELERLVYTSVDAPEELEPPSSLLQFLDHAPRVRDLNLTFSKSKYFSSLTYRNFLLSCPLLQSFRIGHTEDLTGNTFLSEFVLEDLEMCLCPELEYFYCNAMLHVTPEVLHNFILRKNGSGAIPHLKRWKAVDLKVSMIPFTGPPFDDTELLNLSVGLGVSLYVKKMPLIECPLDQGLQKLGET